MDYQEVIKHCEKRRDTAAINPLTPEQYEKAILEMSEKIQSIESELEGLYYDLSVSDRHRY